MIRDLSEDALPGVRGNSRLAVTRIEAADAFFGLRLRRSMRVFYKPDAPASACIW